MLGIRETSIYGQGTYQDLVGYILNECTKRCIEVEFYQSNHEGAIVDKIQEAYQAFDGIIMNPAAYTHTSVAILDALKAVNIPTVEVHLSDVNSREDFRKHSYIRQYCIATYSGHGFDGYIMAIDALCNHIDGQK